MEEKTKVYKLRRSVVDNLSYERLSKGISQKELAEKIGTSKSSISRLESGEQNVTLDYVEAIAKALNMDAKIVLNDHKLVYGDSCEYELKLYDEVLVGFTMKREKELEVAINYVNDEKKHLLPLDLERTNEGLVKWFKTRSIPENRELAGNILRSFGLEIDDIKGIIDICLGLSLNDSYWITRKGFSGTFDDYNLYENRFTEALSIVAYTGWGYNGEEFKTTPELTTGGMLRKAWRFNKSKGIWLYKGGTSGFANAGNEPFSEFYASQVAETMGLNCTKYELENWHGILASKCKLFTSKDISYIPVGRIVKTGGIQACIDFYKDLGDSFFQELASMLVFDAIVLNEDRHYGNFGILRDNHSGEIVAPAPIFDNGISLLCYAMKEDFDKGIDNYIARRSNPYGEKYKYINLARSVMGPLQKKQIRSLINFKFRESDLINLPTWRIKALEEMIQKRVKMLLLEE